MKKLRISSYTGVELLRRYAYLSANQWTDVDALCNSTGLSVSQYFSRLVAIEAAKAKEQNVCTRPNR